MNMTTSTMGRWAYFWQGFLLMALKYNLDRAIAWWEFHRSWHFWNYVVPHGSTPLASVFQEEWRFYLILLLISVPFLAVGIWLTLRRLRDAGLSPVLCLLFFIPVINVVFFVLLSLIPSRTADEGKGVPASGGWGRFIPDSALGSALASTFLVGPVGFGLALAGTTLFHDYGWGLFVGLPFAMGLAAVLIYAWRRPRSLASSLGVALLPIVFIGICFFASAVEGLVCLLMALPIGGVLALLGGLVGSAIARARLAGLPPGTVVLLFVSIPFLMGMERQADVKPPLLSIASSVVIDAPPEKVWPNLIACSPIPPEREWILRTGIAYPTRAVIVGHGVGAVRHCIFSTGEFVEPIEVWDEPRLLRFSVTAQPEPMEELSPYGHIDTPHLHGYFLSREGELRLVPLPGGKTRLEGTTWYTNNAWPNAYWCVWSDFLIHHIHLRVLNHIKAVSES